MNLKKSFLILLLVFNCFFAIGDNVRLSWCPTPDETNANFVGYTLYYGTNVITTNWTPTIINTNDPCSSNVVSRGSNFLRSYTTTVNVGRTTTAIVSNLTPGITYYFAVTAFGMSDLGESDYSDEFRYTVPLIRSNVPPSQPQNFQYFSSVNITNGLVLHWKFDEGNGTNTGDTSINKLTGTFIGSSPPTWASPGIGTAALFFNGNSIVSSPASTVIDPNSGDMSFVLWFKTSAQSQNQIIGGKCSATGVYYVLEVSNGGNLTTAVQCEHGSPTMASTTGINYADGNWHNAAMVWNGITLKASLYADGKFVAISTGTTSGLLDPGGSFMIGGVTNIFSGLSFTGNIDEVSLYNRQLTVNEISSLSNVTINK